jgi:hypothetical protein
MCGTGKMKIDIETEKGHLRSGRSTRPSGCMTLQIGWLHGGANWHLRSIYARLSLRSAFRGLAGYLLRLSAIAFGLGGAVDDAECYADGRSDDAPR